MQQPLNEHALAEQAVRAFLEESKGDLNQMNSSSTLNISSSSNMNELRDAVNNQAQETRERGDQLRGNSTMNTSYNKNTTSYSNQNTSNTRVGHRNCAHTHMTDDKAQLNKWSQPSVRNSKLLTGGSANFKHLPGAQYCVDAGLHHHHHSILNISKSIPGYKHDANWFVEMERKQKAIAHEQDKERNACCPNDSTGQQYQIRFAVLSKHLEDMNQLQQDRLQQDKENGMRNEAELQKKQQELAELYAAMLQKDRDQWRQILENQQQTYLHDLHALRDHYENLQKNQGPVQQCNHETEIYILKRDNDDLRTQQADLQRKQAQKDRELADKDAEIARLRGLLGQQQNPQQIEVREGSAKSVIPPRHKATGEGESLWGSGPINKQRLGQSGAVKDLVPEIVPTEIAVKDIYGHAVDSAQVRVVKIA